MSMQGCKLLLINRGSALRAALRDRSLGRGALVDVATYLRTAPLVDCLNAVGHVGESAVHEASEGSNSLTPEPELIWRPLRSVTKGRVIALTCDSWIGALTSPTAPS
jgi:hypothetical protein